VALCDLPEMVSVFCYTVRLLVLVYIEM
jgi:hypothetical protein